MGRIGRGWQLAKMSLRVVRKDKEILLFPLLSGIITILILASFFVGVFFTSGLSDANSWTFYIFFFVFYFVTFFISIFFNAAVIGCATIRMNGGDPVFADGIRTATQNIKQILFWALFAATVGLILRAIQQRVGFLGKIIVGALGAAADPAAVLGPELVVRCRESRGRAAQNVHGPTPGLRIEALAARSHTEVREPVCIEVARDQRSPNMVVGLGGILNPRAVLRPELIVRRRQPGRRTI